MLRETEDLVRRGGCDPILSWEGIDSLIDESFKKLIAEGVLDLSKGNIVGIVTGGNSKDGPNEVWKALGEERAGYPAVVSDKEGYGVGRTTLKDAGFESLLLCELNNKINARNA